MGSVAIIRMSKTKELTIMFKNKKNMLNTCLLIISFVFIFQGCKQDVDKVIDKKAKVYSLPVEEVKNKDIPVYYKAIGSVISDNQIQISSRITSYIKNIMVREGQQITKGQLLVVLDDADIAGAIQQAEAAVRKARSAQKDAMIDLQHYEALFKKGSAPENTLRKVRLQRDINNDTLSATMAVLKTAEAQRQYVMIKSPVNGIVVKRQKRAGDLAIPGISILSIESEKAILFGTFVPESQIKKIAEGDEVNIIIDALEETRTGSVLRIMPSGDPVTRSFEIKIVFYDTTNLLTGMFGRVRFKLGNEKALVIARTAVAKRGGLCGVFVVGSDHRAYFRWLRTGREWRDYIQIMSGVSLGERIVTNYVSLIQDGDLVKGEDNNEKY